MLDKNNNDEMTVPMNTDEVAFQPDGRVYPVDPQAKIKFRIKRSRKNSENEVIVGSLYLHFFEIALIIPLPNDDSPDEFMGYAKFKIRTGSPRSGTF